MPRNLTIGILAVQGDFERHQHQLDLLKIKSCLVKLPKDLSRVDGLIIPGGESTTMNIMFDRFYIREPLVEFVRSRPVWGTCAGMIMLAKKVEDNLAGVETLGALDVDLLRNGYGRQVFSFEKNLKMNSDSSQKVLKATFIRAPKITRMGEKVKSLIEYDNSPVLVSEGNILASSFHTELDNDTTLLEYYIKSFF